MQQVGSKWLFFHVKFLNNQYSRIDIAKKNAMQELGSYADYLLYEIQVDSEPVTYHRSVWTPRSSADK